MNREFFAERGDPGLRIPGNGKNALREALVKTVVETSLPMLLRYEDRNSMHFSVESRVPFLTPKFVTYCQSLPEEHLLADDGLTKAVFRKAMRGIVPDPILDRRDKIGFATPEQKWLSLLQPWVEKTLSGEGIRRVAALDARALRADWNDVIEGRAPFD